MFWKIFDYQFKQSKCMKYFYGLFLLFHICWSQAFAQDQSTRCFPSENLQSFVLDKGFVMPSTVYEMIDKSRKDIEILRVDLCQNMHQDTGDESYFYKVIILKPDGHVESLQLNAQTGNMM